jgi:plasmid stabilization system protein ParE
MAGHCRYSRQAEEDLLGIHPHISQHSVTAASNLLRKIDIQCRDLARMPGLGVRRDRLRPGLRQWLVGELLNLYLAEADGIFVVRVVHGRTDLTKLFGRSGPQDD